MRFFGFGINTGTITVIVRIFFVTGVLSPLPVDIVHSFSCPVSDYAIALGYTHDIFQGQYV